MKITVERFDFGSNETLSKLYIDGVFMCYCIEDEVRQVKIKGESCIPVGTYKVGKRHSPKFSPKFGHPMLWVKDVPGFEFILIHTGNTDNDTEGCLIVGMRIGSLDGKRAVLDSKIAYNKIYPIISEAIDRFESVEIEYMNKKLVA
jgi:hypothetical protein